MEIIFAMLIYFLTALLVGTILYLTIGKKLKRSEKKGQETEVITPKEKEKTLSCPLNEIMGYEFVTIQKVNNPDNDVQDSHFETEEQDYINPLRAVGGIPDNEHDAEEENRFVTVASTNMPQTASEQTIPSNTENMVDEQDIDGPIVDMDVCNYMDYFNNDEDNEKDQEDSISEWLCGQKDDNSSSHFNDIQENEEKVTETETDEEKKTTDDLLEEFCEIKTTDDIETASEISSLMGN